MTLLEPAPVATNTDDGDHLRHITCCRSDGTVAFCGAPVGDEPVPLPATTCVVCYDLADMPSDDCPHDGHACPSYRG